MIVMTGTTQEDTTREQEPFAWPSERDIEDATFDASELEIDQDEDRVDTIEILIEEEYEMEEAVVPDMHRLA